MKLWLGGVALLGVLVGFPLMAKVSILTDSEAKLLIEQVNSLSDRCRGGSGDDFKTMEACNQRDSLENQLTGAGWCFGEGSEAGYLRYWKTCGATRQAEILEVEKTFGVQYAGKFVKAIRENRDKSLEWFKNKAFELEYAFELLYCLQGVCYFQPVNTSDTSDRIVLAIYQQRGDFNGRWVQGDYVRVIGVDRSGNFLLTRLN